MTEILSAAQMRSIELAEIESGAVSGLTLMERAGQGVVAAIFETWPELAEGSVASALQGSANLEKRGALPPETPRDILSKRKRAVVLCGPGNNGGDGFVIARLLAARGWAVDVGLLGDAARLPPDARANFDAWRAVGAVLTLSEAAARLPAADLAVDAVFGTGLARPVEGAARDALRAMAAWGGRVVAVDIPSGLCADSGRVLGDWDIGAAALTVSFHRAKLGHYLAQGPACCGHLVVKGIGLPEAQVGLPLVAAPDAARLAKRAGHKFGHGHALVCSGGAGRSGAARLAARGALRVGAGLVTLGVPPSAQMEVAGHITALMMQRVAGAEGLAAVLEDVRLNALCLGPGLGVGRARDLVPVALAARRATVLDADALSAFGDAPVELFGALHPGCVLTPHGGEFARLFPDLAARLGEPAARGPAFSKVEAAQAAAARAGCVVLFKGADTVIAAPDGACALHTAAYGRAAPWLATAGSGDVLAGVITGLLARGLAPFEAAQTGAWLHAEAARTFGPGLIAEDVPDMLPRVFRDLGL